MVATVRAAAFAWVMHARERCDGQSPPAEITVSPTVIVIVVVISLPFPSLHETERSRPSPSRRCLPERVRLVGTSLCMVNRIC